MALRKSCHLLFLIFNGTDFFNFFIEIESPDNF
jgi:hypothetical protein